MKTETYRNYTIEIEQSEDVENPRNWDNATLMICSHKRYNLGDEKHDIDFNNYSSWEECKKAIIKKYNPVVIKPLYMYDHSGITISTSPFGDRWDSGQIGWVIFTREKALEEYGGKRITPAIKEKCENLLNSEVETYDNYLRGAVYDFTIKDENGDEVENGVGRMEFYGYDHEKSGLMSEARGRIDAKIKEVGQQIKIEL